MKTKGMWRAAALAMFGLAFAATGAKAGVSDALTVTITPNAGYGVTVTTTNAAALNLGTVNLGTTVQTVVPSTITITSSFATTNLTLSASVAAPLGTPWTFATGSTTSLTTDQMAAWAVFTDTSVQTAPLGSGGVGNYFVGGSSATGSNLVAGTPQTVGGAFGTGQFITATAGTSGAKTMVGLPPGPANGGNWAGVSYLYLAFKLPPATTSAVAQNITFMLTAHQ